MNFSTYYSSYSVTITRSDLGKTNGVNNSIVTSITEWKTEWSLFAKSSFLNDALEIFGDLQFRKIGYKTTGLTSDLVNMLIDQTYDFFNPKFGLSYELNLNSNVFFSYSRANREPSRSIMKTTLI